MKRGILEVTIILIVAIVWSVSVVADIFSDQYTSDPLIHFAMMGILGVLFGKGYFNGMGASK